MSNFIAAHETVIQFPKPRAAACYPRQNERPDAMTAELQATLAREEALRTEIDDLLRRQETLTREFERRLANSLEVIASLLSLQSRAATTPEAAAQLRGTARRIAAAGRLRCRLNLFDR
jgi:two-component sensor histidine kinase